MGVARHVVGAEAFFEDDGAGVALEKSPEAFFQGIRGPDDACEGQIRGRQVKQIVNVPMKFLGCGRNEISITQADGMESLEHLRPDSVRTLSAAPGGVANQPVGQGRRAFLRHRRSDVDVLARRKLYNPPAFESAEWERGILREANPQDIRPAVGIVAQEDERRYLRIHVERLVGMVW